MRQGFYDAEADRRVVGSDLRVRGAEGGPCFYPDIVAYTATAEVDADNCLLKPSIIIEVLSETTASFDRDNKFRAYRRIPSLRHYLLIAQDGVRVEHFSCLPMGIWEFVAEYSLPAESVKFAELDISLPLAEICWRVNF